MTHRKRRLRWVAVAAVGLGLLTIVAWRHETVSRHGSTAQAMHAWAARVEQPPGSTHPSALAAESRLSRSPTEDDPEVQACSLDFQRSLQDFRARLGPARNADQALDLLLLDMMSSTRDELSSPFPDEKYQAAAHRWPSSVELAWLSFNHCVGPNCDREAELQRLIAADPDNTATWMAAMASARERDDWKGWAVALKHASEARFYDPGTGVVVLRTHELLVQVPAPDSCMSTMARLASSFGHRHDDSERIDIMAQGFESAVSLPFFPALRLCGSSTPALTELQRKQCLVVLSMVAQGDTLMEQTFALHGLLELENDPTRLRQWREQYRQIKWLVAQIGMGLEADGLPPHFITFRWSKGEFQAYKSLAIQRHRWPPPPDWLPDDPNARALVTGEPPPPN